jgi:succinyl-diaminopimelate desuccinylase
MPKVATAPDGSPVDFSLGMNLVDLREMRRLTEVLVRIVLRLPEFEMGCANGSA